MREQTFVLEIQKLWSALKGVAQGLQITTISQSVRDKALENLLIAKGVITTQELEDEVKKEAQAMVEETQKAQAASTILVPPTTESGLILPGSVGL